MNWVEIVTGIVIVIVSITIGDAKPNFDCLACLKYRNNELRWAPDINSLECKRCDPGYYNNGTHLICLKNGEDTGSIEGGADICNNIPLEVYRRFFNTPDVSENQKDLLKFLEKMKIETEEQLKGLLEEKNATEKQYLLSEVQKLIELLKEKRSEISVSENQKICRNFSEEVNQLKEQIREHEEREQVATEKIMQIYEKIEQVEKKMESASTEDETNCQKNEGLLREIKEMLNKIEERDNKIVIIIVCVVLIAVVVGVGVVCACCRKKVHTKWQQIKETCCKTNDANGEPMVERGPIEETGNRSRNDEETPPERPAEKTETNDDDDDDANKNLLTGVNVDLHSPHK